MKEATINDVKRLWNLQTGFYFFSKEQREAEWKRYVKNLKRSGWSIQQAYTLLSEATGRI